MIQFARPTRQKLNLPFKAMPPRPITRDMIPGLYNRGANQRAIGSFKKGGKVRKTGLYKLHKSERVLTKKQARKYASVKK